ncbi:unnamed protein product, partial [Ectocarpus sp. 8 AP-2014]
TEIEGGGGGTQQQLVDKMRVRSSHVRLHPSGGRHQQGEPRQKKRTGADLLCKQNGLHREFRGQLCRSHCRCHMASRTAGVSMREIISKTHQGTYQNPQQHA